MKQILERIQKIQCELDELIRMIHRMEISAEKNSENKFADYNPDDYLEEYSMGYVPPHE